MSKQGTSITPSSYALQHAVDIDEMLLRVAATDERIEHLRALKKHRTAIIDEEIRRETENRENLRESIKQIMSSTGDKVLKFPGVANVTRKPGTSTWVIKDQVALLTYLRTSSGLSSQTLEEIIVVEETIAKGKLNKVLDELAKHGALKTDAVVRETGPESVAIAFDKGDEFALTVKDTSAALQERQAAAATGIAATPPAAATPAQTSPAAPLATPPAAPNSDSDGFDDFDFL